MTKYSKGGARAFLKRNAAYLIMLFCVLATALIIIFAATANNGDTTKLPPDEQGDVQKPPLVTDPDDELPVITDPEPFALPVTNATIGYTFNLESPVKLSITDRNNNPVWVMFKEVEFIAAEGTEVKSVYDGNVISVKYDIVDGTVIKIQHSDGLVSTYKYLQKEASVKEGDTVKKGDVIGYIGVSYNMQYNIGAHLCFGLLKDGKNIDPSLYLEF